MVELPTYNSAPYSRSGHNCIIGLRLGSFMFFCVFLAQPTLNCTLTKASLESHGMKIWLQISKFAAPNGGLPGPAKFFHFTSRGLPFSFQSPLQDSLGCIFLLMVQVIQMYIRESQMALKLSSYPKFKSKMRLNCL